jgi:uncharacterized protein YegP (UPF0339 family)
MKYKIELWKGLDGQWYWHVVSARNGQIVCTSEGYKRRGSALKSAQRISLNLANAMFVWLD